MSDFDDFDWGDDPFGGDIDFDSDFDSPGSSKGFIRSLTSGFLSGIVDSTVGSTDARVKTLEKVLPSTFKKTFSNLRSFERTRQEYFKLAKESSVELVDDLQYFSKVAAAKISKGSPNRISSALIKFSEKDFSDWKPYQQDSGREGMEEVTDAEVKDLLEVTEANSLLERATVEESTNKTIGAITATGARNLATLNGLNSVLLRNNELLQRLVNHQLSVKAKTDALQLSVLTRTYLTNVKFYKFTEKTNHRLVKELKDIAKFSKMSDYEKTSHSDALKKSIRESIFSTVGNPLRGFDSLVRNLFKNTIPEGVEGLSGMTSMARMGMEISDGMPINYGEMAGKILGGALVDNLPKLAKTKYGTKAIDGLKGLSPELTNSISTIYKDLEDFGNVTTNLTSNLPEIINRLSTDRSFDWGEDDFYDYEDYLDNLKEGQRAKSKAEWSIGKRLRKLGSVGLEKLLDANALSDPTQFDLEKRTLLDNKDNYYWTKQSDRTLNEIIPKWLSELHLSMEKLRTGDDSLKAMSYDYANARFVRPEIKAQRAIETVLGKSEFGSQAESALRAVDEIDVDGTLSPQARKELAFQLTKNAVEGKGLNPYALANFQGEGVSPEVANEIRQLIQKELGLTDDILKEYKEANDLDRLGMEVLLPSEKGRERIVGMSESVRSLAGLVPDVGKRIDLLRASGEYDSLLDSGIIYKDEYGADKLRDNIIYDTLRGYIDDKDYNPVNDLIKTEEGRNLVEVARSQRLLTPERNTPTIDYNNEELVIALTEGLEPLSTLGVTLAEVTDKLGGLNNLSNINLDISPVTSELEKLNLTAGELLTGSLSINTTLVDILNRQPKASTDSLTKEEEEVAKTKKGIISRIASLDIKGMADKGIGKLLDAEPLVLGGLLGGLATTALFNPKAGMLLAGGAAAMHLYGKYSEMAKARNPEDSEDLYQEGSEDPILYAHKLRDGKYVDAITQKVIQSWKDISGSVIDTTTRVVIRAKELAGKLFTASNKEVFLSGLNKVKDLLTKTYRAIDPISRLRRFGDRVGKAIYQMDVYRKGDDHPVLLGIGFKEGRYFKLNDSNELIPLNGWNEIDGPVYDKNQQVLVTQGDFEDGLITSAGLNITKAGKALGAAGKGLGALGIRATQGIGRGLGRAKDGAKDILSTNVLPVVESVDRIYDLMKKHWGYGDGSSKVGPTINPPKGYEEDNKEELRLNSREDILRREKEDREARYQEAMIEGMGELKNLSGKEGDKKEDKEKGLFGLISSGWTMIKGFGKGLMGFLTGPLLTGITWMTKFATMGLKLFPLMLKGITSMVGLLAKGGRGVLDAILPGRKGKGGGLGRRMPGLKTMGVGLGLGLAGSALASTGVIEEGGMVDTGLGYASTAASVYGAAQFVAPTATAAATAGVGSALASGLSWAGGALMTGAGWLGSAIGTVVSSPVAVGAIVVGGAAYTGYRYANRGIDKQLDLRMLQYGIAKDSSTTGKKVLLVENKLKDFVNVENGSASFKPNAPIEDVMKLFITNIEDQQEVGLAFEWFNGRFKPVFLTYMAMLKTVKMESLKEYDESKDWKVYEVAEQVHKAIMYVQPRPYEVITLDKDFKPKPLEETIQQVEQLLTALKKFLDRKDDLAKVDTLGEWRDAEAEAEEIKANLEKTESGIWNNSYNPFSNKSKMESRLKELDEEAARLNSIYRVGTVVGDISIKDLLQDGKDIDLLTAMRLEAYGNSENIPWRAEAVLKLERYCEDFFVLRDTQYVFMGKVGEIYQHFKEAFRGNKRSGEEWAQWFRDRFIPVLTTYINKVAEYRRGKPKAVWHTLTATAKYEIAKALLEAKVLLNGKKEISVFRIRSSPFIKSRSNTSDSNAKKILARLERLAEQARIRNPALEDKETSRDSQDSNLDGTATRTDRGSTEQDRLEEERYKEELLKNDSESDSYNNLGLDQTPSEGKQSGTTYPGTQSTIESAGIPDYEIPDNGNYEPVSIPDNIDGISLDGVKPVAAGKDRGVKIPPEVGRELIVKEMVNAGFDDPREIAFQLANVEVESGNYRATAESFHYSSPRTMRGSGIGAWQNLSDSQLNAIRQLPYEQVAESAYGKDTSMGRKLGHTQPGEGWAYRGRGLTQTTGKKNYVQLAKDIGVDVVSNPRLVSDDPSIAVKSAVSYYKKNIRNRAMRNGKFDVNAAINAVSAYAKGNEQKRANYAKFLPQIQNGTFKIGDKTLEELKHSKPEETATTNTEQAPLTNQVTTEQAVVDKEVNAKAPLVNKAPATMDDPMLGSSATVTESNEAIASATSSEPSTPVVSETPVQPAKVNQPPAKPVEVPKQETPKVVREEVVSPPVVDTGAIGEAISTALKTGGTDQLVLLQRMLEELTTLNKNLSEKGTPKVRLN